MNTKSDGAINASVEHEHSTRPSAMRFRKSFDEIYSQGAAAVDFECATARLLDETKSIESIQIEESEKAPMPEEHESCHNESGAEKSTSNGVTDPVVESESLKSSHTTKMSSVLDQVVDRNHTVQSSSQPSHLENHCSGSESETAPISEETNRPVTTSISFKETVYETVWNDATTSDSERSSDVSASKGSEECSTNLAVISPPHQEIKSTDSSSFKACYADSSLYVSTGVQKDEDSANKSSVYERAPASEDIKFPVTNESTISCAETISRTNLSDVAFSSPDMPLGTSTSSVLKECSNDFGNHSSPLYETKDTAVQISVDCNTLATVLMDPFATKGPSSHGSDNYIVQISEEVGLPMAKTIAIAGIEVESMQDDATKNATESLPGCPTSTMLKESSTEQAMVTFPPQEMNSTKNEQDASSRSRDSSETYKDLQKTDTLVYPLMRGTSTDKPNENLVSQIEELKEVALKVNSVAQESVAVQGGCLPLPITSLVYKNRTNSTTMFRISIPDVRETLVQVWKAMIANMKYFVRFTRNRWWSTQPKIKQMVKFAFLLVGDSVSVLNRWYVALLRLARDDNALRRVCGRLEWVFNLTARTFLAKCITLLEMVNAVRVVLRKQLLPLIAACYFKIVAFIRFRKTGTLRILNIEPPTFTATTIPARFAPECAVHHLNNLSSDEISKDARTKVTASPEATE